ncbi:MAG: malate dehydrogenase [Spirochaetes bacterium GWF1_41_5]|nr:MAG: malate dehydrogenase [Spirochaetes bacterium GWF1_41_5]HBE02317.1 NAD-dependent malic enzyme [Spirochaetia bacterium]
MDYRQISIDLHKKYRGKLDIITRFDINNKHDLSSAYSPGVAAPCLEIQKDGSRFKEFTSAGSTIAVISDGSAVLGLGNIGARASMPVMEGKAALFRRFGGINAFPIVLETQDTEEIIKTITHIAPSFGGINLEDISAPRCFTIENRLADILSIPVFHDDQHGTAIVSLAGLINASKITGKGKKQKIIINGSGAAGIATARLLAAYEFQNIIMCDTKGIIHSGRDDLHQAKKDILAITNPANQSGSIFDAIKNADVFIGLSKGNLLKAAHIKTMNHDAVVFAMANPTPEIMPDEAIAGGARIVATGRSDFPNQLNNVLVFPGIFKGALACGAVKITTIMKIAAAESLSSIITNPDAENIIPSPFTEGVADCVAQAVKNCMP